jgi:hypothetical protein
MRFEKYLEEEYFGRAEEFEIFMNPSNKEILTCWNKNNSRAIRALADFGNNVLFVFESDLLHQVAIKQIVKDYKKSGTFYCIEAWDKNDRVRLTETGEGFKVVNGKALSVYLGEKEPTRADMIWLKNKFKFLGKIEEEYLHSKGHLEIHKNPSYKEMIKFSKDDNHQVRLFFDLKNNDFYGMSVGYYHDHAEKDMNFPKDLMRAEGEFINGILHIVFYHDRDGIEEFEENKDVINLLKDHGIKAKWDIKDDF